MTEITYYIERKTDGHVARVIIEDAVNDEGDPWKPLEVMPIAWDLVDERMMFFDTPDHPDFWEETFYADEDAEFAAWLVGYEGHYEGDLGDDHGCAVNIEAVRLDGFAAVTWTPRDGGAARAMDISLNPGDFERIFYGADPVAEGWEDGFGSVVSFDNAEEVA